MNQSCTSDYYDQRADFIGLAAKLFLHSAVVHQHAGSAANKTLEELVSATCKVSQLKPHWPYFRGYTNRGHEGVERVFHLLKKLFLNLDDEESSGWTNPTWGEALSRLATFWYDFKAMPLAKVSRRLTPQTRPYATNFGTPSGFCFSDCVPEEATRKLHLY